MDVFCSRRRECSRVCLQGHTEALSLFDRHTGYGYDEVRFFFRFHSIYGSGLILQANKVPSQPMEGCKVNLEVLIHYVMNLEVLIHHVTSR